MKQLGYRLDVSFMALVLRCLLPDSGVGLGTPTSNVCGMIADDYNDRILNQEINQQELKNKIVIVPDDININTNINGMGGVTGVKHVLRRMKEFRVNVMNSTITYYDLRGPAEMHYQELKSLRKQWRMEKEAASPWWSLSLRPMDDNQHTPYQTHYPASRTN